MGLSWLLLPFRHPNFCLRGKNDSVGLALTSLNYLVHDFERMCLKLKPSSKIVLIDMGESLEFHSSSIAPIMDLMRTYEKFGFFFDHIYAFEATETKPEKVYKELLPEKYFPSYHWINTGK